MIVSIQYFKLLSFVSIPKLLFCTQTLQVGQQDLFAEQSNVG